VTHVPADNRITDIFPKIPQVKRLLVCEPNMDNIDVSNWVDTSIWLRSFQGLINRDEPHLYIMPAGSRIHVGGGPNNLTHWLDYYLENYDLPTESMGDLDVLFERYKHLLDGYVVYDTDDVIQTQNLAITRAGIEGLLPIAPSQEDWAIRHGLTKRDDLRGRFADDWDAAEWAIDNLWPQCNQRIYANLCIHRTENRAIWQPNAHDLDDLIVYHKGFALDLIRNRMFRRQQALAHKMYESGDAPGAQLNWHCAWEQEKEYVAEAAKYGYFTLCTVGSPNMTVHGGIGDTERSYVQPLPDADDCVAENDKVYLSFYNSDGDATWVMHNLQSNNWMAPGRGETEFAWGFLPLMVRIAPGMYRYYQDTRGPSDSFWGPSSGAGYTYSCLWPDNLVEQYLDGTRELLDQSGQNGCNMVNWYLRDWWREVEDDDAIAREQKHLSSGPGLVCGLGGSPYARSYMNGPIPKTHSVHIANAGRDNVDDIARFIRECPTRPLFMFLFAQIAEDVWEQVAADIRALADHTDVEVLSMDKFFLTLQNAIERDLVANPLYETNDATSETWLRQPGRHRLPIAEKMCTELAEVASLDPENRRRSISDAGWTDLVSRELEGAGQDREEFLALFAGRPGLTETEEADALLYVAFTVTWAAVRAAIEAQGIYANHRTQCIDDFVRTCGDIVDIAPFERIFEAWDTWESGAPTTDETAALCRAVAAEVPKLRDTLGPDESEDEFSGWPPRTI
jgi:hypothetical protein